MMLAFALFFVAWNLSFNSESKEQMTIPLPPPPAVAFGITGNSTLSATAIAH
jgi:hypothetical protein